MQEKKEKRVPKINRFAEEIGKIIKCTAQNRTRLLFSCSLTVYYEWPRFHPISDAYQSA